jgi:hypothetical protein
MCNIQRSQQLPQPRDPKTRGSLFRDRHEAVEGRARTSRGMKIPCQRSRRIAYTGRKHSSAAKAAWSEGYAGRLKPGLDRQVEVGKPGRKLSHVGRCLKDWWYV